MGDYLSDEVSRLLAREVAECMFNVNLSLFKGLFYFVSDNQADQLASRLGQRRDNPAGSVRHPIDEERFMRFLKDDVRPFVLCLLHTRSFKVTDCLSSLPLSCLLLKL